MREAEGLSHRRETLGVRLKPNREFDFARDDSAGAIIDFLDALFNAGRGIRDFGDGHEFAALQFAAKAWADGIAVTDHANFIKIADTFAARAFDDEIVEEAIDRISDAVAFAFVVTSRDGFNHRPGLIDQENKATGINPAYFGRIRHCCISKSALCFAKA